MKQFVQSYKGQIVKDNLWGFYENLMKKHVLLYGKNFDNINL